jgi:hypothetical protein
MNTIEDRLRAATQAAADTVTGYSQPPLRLPARARGYGLTRPRIAAPRLMASVAAAAAIVAVVATVVVTRDVAAGHRAAADRAAGALKAEAPPFFLAAFTTKNSPEFTEGALAVGRTATGKILATVRPPAPYTTFGAIGAAADDRTFVVTAQKPPRGRLSHLEYDPGPARLYLLRLHLGHTPAVTLTALPIPVFRHKTAVIGISLSPSGTRLAVGLQGVNSNYPTGLRVYDLANDSFTDWSLAAGQSGAALASGRLSWVDGNRYLATMIISGRPKGCRQGCVQLLDTARPGGSIMRVSKTIFATAKTHRYAFWRNFLITPDGSRMILTGEGGRRVSPGSSFFDTPLIYTIAVPSGHILAYTAARHGPDFIPLWAGIKGRPTILGHHLSDGYLAATIYGEHQRTRSAELHLPAKTLTVVW